jgi:hypothetical protein
MAAFRRELAGRFLEDLVRHLRRNFAGPAGAVGGDAELRAFAARCLKKGEGYGLDTAEAVTTLAELMIQFGEELRWSPLREWTLNILNTPRLPGGLKAERIRERYEELTGSRVVVRCPDAPQEKERECLRAEFAGNP